MGERGHFRLRSSPSVNRYVPLLSSKSTQTCNRHALGSPLTLANAYGVWVGVFLFFCVNIKSWKAVKAVNSRDRLPEPKPSSSQTTIRRSGPRRAGLFVYPRGRPACLLKIGEYVRACVLLVAKELGFSKSPSQIKSDKTTAGTIPP